MKLLLWTVLIRIKMWSPIYIGILCLVPIISGRASVTPEDPKDTSPDPEFLGSIPISVAAILGPCGNNRDPIPNLDSALRGYNVIQGNQFFPHGNDPGFKLKIFKGSYDPDAPDDPDASGDKCTYSNIQQFEATYCKKSGNSRSYRSYQDYQEAKTGSVANSVSVSASVSAGGLASFISSFEATSSFSSSTESEFSKEKKFFSEEKGEIYMNKAQCEVFEVRISSLTKPKFTSDFISALKNLENAAKSPDSAASKVAMKEFFTEQFGTHYMSSVFMGASMTTENRYVGTTSSSEMRNMRRECSDNAYSMSIGAGAEGVDVSTEFEIAAKKCKGDDTNDAFFSENSYNEFNVVTRGSIPTADEDVWRENIKESPIPIRFELKPISALFRADWLEEHGLDATLLQDYVTNSLRSYCEVVLGRACVPVKGCGVTGFCSDNEVCSSDFANKTSGFRCDSCGYGWKFNPDNKKCYKFDSEELSWKDGQKQCIAKSPNPFGDLATAPDKNTIDFVSSLHNVLGEVFLGGFKTSDSEWHWTDGSQWGFTSWAPGEPNNFGGHENRLTTNNVYAGSWNDVTSEQIRPFFCQYPLKGKRS